MIESAHVPAAGLYAVTPDGWPAGRLLAAVEQALTGGAPMVQYRAKPRPDAEIAAELLVSCHRHGARLIINDDVKLAARIGADGVHLGRGDQDITSARDRLGPGTLIGASCYNDLERARQLSAAGADYLAFGSLFASPTKPDAVHCPLDVITRAAAFGRPIAAIGGITLATAAQVFEAGARWVAVISDLFEAEDITQRACDYQELIHP